MRARLAGAAIAAALLWPAAAHAFADPRAEMEAEFCIQPFNGQTFWMLKYDVFIGGSDPFGLEEITSITANISSPGQFVANNPTITKINDRRSTVKFSFMTNVAQPMKLPVRLRTFVTEKRRNNLQVDNIMLIRGGVMQTSPAIPGYDWSNASESTRGIYTLFNDGTEDWHIDRLLVRVNRDELDTSAFDLSDPDVFDWDYDIAPFELAAGNSFSLDLGVALIESPDVFSQAYVAVTGADGIATTQIQQHQGTPAPAPIVLLGGAAAWVLVRTPRRATARSRAI